MNKRKNRPEKEKKVQPFISVEVVKDLAADFLLMKVGNLLMAGEPSFLHGQRCWKVPILLGNVRSGLLGQVGKLRVDAETGEVLFTDEERTRIEAQANELYQRSKASWESGSVLAVGT